MTREEFDDASASILASAMTELVYLTGGDEGIAGYVAFLAIGVELGLLEGLERLEEVMEEIRKLVREREQEQKAGDHS